MKIKHCTIPIFVPEEACPNRCVFCNQFHIANTAKAPEIEEVISKIENYLLTIPSGTQTEIGFFGGNFTGIPPQQQERYLRAVQPYLKNDAVQGIRLSTRPDYINQQILDMLKKYQVKAIELGAQSLHNDVLDMAGRGHTVEDVALASELITSNGFELGLQMMIGLPGDSLEKSLQTAEKIISLKASTTRIYPTLVIKNTQLETLYKQGLYKPLSLAQAISQTAIIAPAFIHAGIKILRMGLHPSEGLTDETNLVDGPFHVAFGELVLSKIWENTCVHIMQKYPQHSQLIIEVPQGMRTPCIGYKAKNKQLLLSHFKTVAIEENSSLINLNYHAYTR